MTRLRHRPTHFLFHGDRFAFHRHQDGATLGRLDPYAADAQVWPLHSGKVIAVTGADVRDITLQVHGIDLPETRPEGGFANSAAIDARLDAIEARLDALEAREWPAASSVAAEATTDVVEPEQEASDPVSQAPPPVPLPPNPEEAPPQATDGSNVPDDLTERLWDYRTEDKAAEDEITTEDLIADMKKDALATQEVIAKLSRDKRRRFTELLNVEKAELRNKAKATGVSDAREADVDRLLNLFARVGEA